MADIVRRMFRNKKNNQFSITLPKKLLEKDKQFMKGKKKKIKLKILGFE